LFACGGSAVGQTAASSPTPTVSATPPADATAPPVAAAPVETQPSAKKGEAHQLAIGAVACWLGGVWSDAEARTEEARGTEADRRCDAFVNRLYGSYDKTRTERLRALDPVEVSSLKDKISAAAQAESLGSARAAELGKFIDVVADAEREVTLARRAGDRVKKDIEGERESGKLTTDEADAVAPLGESAAFNTLLTVDLGELTAEARAIAVLCAMDRMETARGLTKHLKVYAVERPYSAFFNVAPPDVPRDAHKPLKPGTWLAYLTSVAAAAGHAVPEHVKAVQDREALAWGGVLVGLADKLRAQTPSLSDETELKKVAEGITRRIENEYRSSEAGILHTGERSAHHG